ncbi:MAG TPA: hypothetical protein VK057_01000 [Bacillota bacterium]|nr:hypothetical protein [Bacillota bacterium]
MARKAVYPKVAADMFIVQMSWTFWFLGILLAVQIIKMVIGGFQENGTDPYFNSVFIAANVYMLIIGIISIYFLPYYVENGVTRKDYFKGTFLALCGLSVAIPVIAICISTLENLILGNIVQFRDMDIVNSVAAKIDINSNIIGEVISGVVQSVILPPYISPESSWILAIAVFSLNIFMYYLLGWMISASFYRYNVITGLLFIGFSIIILIVRDGLLRTSLNLPVPSRYYIFESLPASILLLGVAILIVIAAVVIRQFTKDVAIKM